MSKKICLVVPEAPPLATSAAGTARKLRPENLRIGILDNSKGNADHLLRFVADGVRAVLPVRSVLTLRKATSGRPAPASMLDRLTAEADLVVSAMAD